MSLNRTHINLTENKRVRISLKQFVRIVYNAPLLTYFMSFNLNGDSREKKMTDNRINIPNIHYIVS